MDSELICSLIDALNKSGVVYCHWKSNFRLGKTDQLETDLDILVDRRSLAQATLILASFGFKSAIVLSSNVSPGISHYYGLDRSTGQLVHVHLFVRVLTGESFVKSHLFPFESMLLEEPGDIQGMKVPSKAAELVVFTLRMLIKYGSMLDLPYLMKDDKEVTVELQWLEPSKSLPKALELLRQYCPVIEDDLFVECVGALGVPGRLLHKMRLARRVRARLRPYSVTTAWEQGWLNLRLLLEFAWRRLARGNKNKVLASGGAVIAFVGPEATGKSTLVSGCEQWLDSALAVRTIHAGKPPSSWLTSPMNAFLPLMRRLLPDLRTSRLEGHGTSSNGGQTSKTRAGLSSLIYAMRAVSIAWDRQRLLVGARRSAARGKIVICDRYPSDEVGQMDSPRLQRNTAGQGPIGQLYNWLATLEGKLYRQIAPPDIAVRLSIPLDVALQRNRERIKPGKENDAYLESRHRDCNEWYRAGTRFIYDVSTEQSLDETLRTVKLAIWGSL